MLYIGTAGWSIPRASAALAPGEGSHLERYARALGCAEINSTFYRSSRASTWQRWAAATPETFRFSVKFPKAITHTRKLVIGPGALDGFFGEIEPLQAKLGPLLVQLPPSLDFAECPAAEFFETLRGCTSEVVALEPRHASWWSDAADELLVQHHIARVAADPVRAPRAVAGALPEPGGWQGLAYYRLHGSPRTYYSAYSAEYLLALADRIRELAAEQVWVIFDNTAAGHAFANAVELQRLSRAQNGARPAVKTRSKSSTRTRSSSSNVD